MYLAAFLTGLKFAAILVTGLLGVLSLRVEYKDDTGRVTKWGRRALLATIAATIIGATTVAVETYKQRSDAKAQDRETLSLLHEIERGVYQLRNVTVSARLTVPLTVPKDSGAFPGEDFLYDDSQRPYVERMLAVPDVRDLSEFERRNCATLLWDERRNKLICSFSKESALYPKADEDFPRNLFDNLGLVISIYKNGQSSAAGQQRRDADLNYLVEASSGVTYYYVFGDSSIDVLFTNIPVTTLKSTDAIVSAVDLSSSRLEASVRNRRSGLGGGIDAEVRSYLRGVIIDYLEIVIDGRPFWIRGDRLHRNKTSGVFVYKLPPDFTKRGSNQAP